jgi:hypothetical protein
MSERNRITRRQLVRYALTGAGLAATEALLGACGINQKGFEKGVVQPMNATQEAAFDNVANGISRVVGSITLPTPTVEPITPVPLSQDQVEAVAPTDNSAAAAEARKQINAVFNKHDQLDNMGQMNAEIATWIYAFMDEKQRPMASSDYDVINYALPYVFYKDGQHNTREDILYALTKARQSGKWQGHAPVPDSIVQFTWKYAARGWGYNAQTFATAPEYEHLRTSLIETAGKAIEAVDKMKQLNLFAHPDEAIPSVGILIAFALTETGGWRNIGDSGPAREKGSASAVDYIVQYTREISGFNVPLTIEGSSAAAIGPQILPGNLVEGINFAKEHAPEAKLNPLDPVDGNIFTAIYLQQNKYDAQSENATRAANGQGAFWYYSNRDDRDSMYTVMTRWNAKADQNQLLTDAHFDYKQLMQSQSSIYQPNARRRFLTTTTRLLIGI